MLFSKLECSSDSPLKNSLLSSRIKMKQRNFNPPPPQLFVWTQTKRDVLTNLSKFFPQKSENLLLTMQKINFAIFKRKLTVFKTFFPAGS